MIFLNGNCRDVNRIAFAGLFACMIGIALNVHAQVGADRIEGLRDNTPRWHAITGARIVVSPDKVIEKGTLVMRDGVVTAVGANVAGLWVRACGSWMAARCMPDLSTWRAMLAYLFQRHQRPVILS
jgi:hypothetical protein